MTESPKANFFPWWSLCVPLLGWLLLATHAVIGFQGLSLILLALALGGTVFSAVHYAEVVAHKVGEPFGTLVLAVAVTIIEVAMIASVLLSNGNQNLAVARDTIFAVVMLVCSGLVGLCITVGAWKHKVQGFNIKGSIGALSAVMALSTLTMVLPVFTSPPEDAFRTAQLIFVGAASLILYAAFVFVQTVRHRDYFIPESEDDTSHHIKPSLAQMFWAMGILLICLVAVVLLAKSLSPTVETLVDLAGMPKPVVGLVIAGFVLLPESLAAIRAANQNKLQTSINLAYGSVIASIGLTIPVVAFVSVFIGKPLILGLDPRDIVLLVLTMLLNIITIQTGRTNILQGSILLVVFAAFLFFAVVP